MGAFCVFLLDCPQENNSQTRQYRLIRTAYRLANGLAFCFSATFIEFPHPRAP
jgi:hypothetical protein